VLDELRLAVARYVKLIQEKGLVNQSAAPTPR